jgi:diacylglycerol kinase family enzyme
MAVASSHHTFHRLSRLLTTFLAQMWPTYDPVEDPGVVLSRKSGTNDQSAANTDSTVHQVVAESSMEQVAIPHQDVEPALSSAPIEQDDGRSPKTFVSEQQPNGQRSDKSAEKYSTGSLLYCKKAYLIINPRSGHNFIRISEVLAILSAAGWKTDIAVKHYVGHAIELATRAAEEEYDLVIAYGGDGTINHVVNGVMAAKGKGRRKAIGVIPGGTANQWSSETSVPVDPVKATLALLESNVHTVDLGRLQVHAILFPNRVQEDRLQQQNGQRVQESNTKKTSSRENYFLLTAGLGIDASVIEHTSKGLKHRIGPLAFDLAVAESLPEQHAFPIEVTIVEDGWDQPLVWSGEAYQVILGNTRRYANAIELTPDVHLDDGKLELCVITTGNAITTLQQITSLLLRHKTDAITAKHFLATHYLITVPASIHMHLDGSPVQLKDYLNKSDREALREEQDRENVMVTYRIDAVPHALRMAIPRTYDNTLFELAGRQEESNTDSQQIMKKGTSHHDDKLHEKLQSESMNLVENQMERGYEVKVTGIATMPNKRQTSIIAGSTLKRRTGETMPVAIRIDKDTSVLLKTGDHAPLAYVQRLPDGAAVVVQGKKSRRGVIRAKYVELPDS